MEEKIIDVQPEEKIPNEPKHNEKKERKGVSFKTMILCNILFLGLGLCISQTLLPTRTIYETQTIIQNTARDTDDMSIQEVVASVKDSVVEINVAKITTSIFGQSSISEGAGSGVIISSDGYIVTNNHVIEDATDKISVTLANGETHDATIIGADAKSDLAVLKIEGSDFTPAVFGNSDTILVGDTAIVIGNPLGKLGGSVTSGIISALDREIDIENQPMNLLQTNAEVNPGNSGGGLFNSKGELIGIVNAKTSATSIEGIGFAIPINDAKDVIEQLIENGYVVNRPTIGIYTSEVSQDTRQYKAGLYITQVIENSPAHQAGLQAYDRIVSIDGTEISAYTQLTRLLQKHKVGDSITMVVERDGKQITVTLTLSSASRS